MMYRGNIDRSKAPRRTGTPVKSLNQKPAFHFFLFPPAAAQLGRKRHTLRQPLFQRRLELDQVFRRGVLAMLRSTGASTPSSRDSPRRTMLSSSSFW